MKPALFLSAVLALALPPAPAQHVTDQAGFISDGLERTLNARLEAVAQRGPQVVVWIGPAPTDAAIEDWAARTFEHWGIGHAGKDDGVGLFVFPDQRKLRIEVGYGLEDRLTDAAASRIIAEQFVPRARAGDADGAVRATVDAVLATVAGEAAPTAYQPRPVPTPLRLGLYGALGLLMLILFITHPRLAFLLLFNIASGRGGRGGGFSGGGGRSGGGGARGSW